MLCCSCLLFLQEHYWKGEAEMTNNYFANLDSSNVTVIQQLQGYIELWQALKLYDDANYTDVKNIPDDDFKYVPDQPYLFNSSMPSVA
jgi:hypothetical protein